MTTGLLESTNASSSTNIASSTISSVLIFEYLSQQVNVIVEKIASAWFYFVHVLSQQPAKLHASRWIYGLYGLLDGVNTAFSTLKYACDVHYANTSFSAADKLHDFLLTPEGIVIVVIESLFLAGFAATGNVFENDEIKYTNWKKWTVILWRYVRDVLKALKNAYKGVSNVLTLWTLIAVQSDVLHLLLPIGVVLGVFSALNQMFIRYMREQRKDKIKINELLLKEINALKLDGTAKPEDWINKLHQLLDGVPTTDDKKAILGMQTQSLWYRALGYVVSIYDGLLYSPYLYLGLVNLAILSPSLFIMVATCAVFFVLIGIAARVFEEYNDQRLLLVSQTKLELAACIAELKCLSKQIETKLQSEDPSIQNVYKEIDNKIRAGVALKQKLQQLSVLSIKEVVLGGLLNGMGAVQVITSIAFAISSICFMVATPFPVLLLLSVGPVGLVSLVGFVGLALAQHWNFLEKNPLPESLLNKQTDPLLYRLKNEPQDVTVEEVQSITDNIEAIPVQASPQTFFEKNIDVVRSFCTGGRKGIRSVDETMVSFQDVGADGHYHDTPIMATVAWVSAGLFAVIFALRGVARLGKTKNKDATEQLVSTKSDTSLSQTETSASDDIDETESQTTQSPCSVVSDVTEAEDTEDSVVSMKKAASYQGLSNFHFFSPAPSPNKFVEIKQSSDDLNEDALLDRYTFLPDNTTEKFDCSRGSLG